MRIGMILDKVYVSDARVENEATTLIADGQEVFLYCVSYDGKAPASEVAHGIEVRRYKVPSYMYSLSALAYTTAHYHKALNSSLSLFISDHQIEVLHVHDMRVARSVFEVNETFKLPVVLDLHENQPEIMKSYHHVNTVLGKLLIYPETWRRFEAEYISRADHVIVVTYEARQYYIDLYSIDQDKIMALPNTVLPEFYTEFTLDQEILDRYQDRYPILYWGDTGFRRGVTTAIDAMDTISEVIPNAVLILAGKSKSDKQLKVYIEKSGMSKAVDMVGWQPFNKFQSYLEVAKVCICPIHRNIHHDTTYANKIFQYLSFGNPIVVSDCPAQANVVTSYDCGMVHKDQDSHDLAEKIISLERDETLYNKISENARKAVREHLNWDRTKDPLLNLYRSI